MLQKYIQKWTIQRFIQLAVGGYFFWNFMEDGGKLSLAFGFLMSFQAIFNVGCFSSKGCSTTTNGAEPQPFAKNIKKITRE